jgi:beta-lactamase superfamily II metal-dependent hydrolase
MPKRSLVVVDVGHGSASVLHDEGGVVVFDGGQGGELVRFLRARGITTVEALLLSHSDSDHIGGAISLLLEPTIATKRLLLNPDATKRSDAFLELRVAVAEARLRGLEVELALTTDTKVDRAGAEIAVLYPPPEEAMGGVGGKSLEGGSINSNSMSAAVLLTAAPGAAILIGGDIGSSALSHLKKLPQRPKARAMIFPHHGGLAATSAEGTATFAREITELFEPEAVIFSNHRTRFSLPRTDVVEAILQARPNALLACTQLPDRLRNDDAMQGTWKLHRGSSAGAYLEGHFRFDFDDGSFQMSFIEG